MRRPLMIPGGKAAALFVDLQEEHRGDQRLLVEGYEAVLANAARLQRAARVASAPVIHCAYIVDPAAARPFHPMLDDGRSAFSDKNDPLTALCPETGPVGDEVVLVKAEANAFGDGRLVPLLRGRGVEWLFVSGVWSEACVDATVRDAVARGFRVVLVKDACGSGTETMHRTAILNLANRLYGGAVVDTDAACRLLAGETVEAWTTDRPVPMRFRADTIDALYRAL